MTLASTVAGLAAFAVVFQTLVYLSLPAHLRFRWAPTTVGFVGAGVVMGAAVIFGFDVVGLSRVGLGAAALWGGATIVGISLVSLGILRGGKWQTTLADARLAGLSRRQALNHIFIRIPFFTAFVEEAFFRGVLHAALLALYPPEVALWLGAGLFGLWHFGPGVDQARASQKSRRQSAMHTLGTVLLMTAAGAFLVWLRMETGSIWAPFAVHAGINMTMALFARFAARRPTSASELTTVNL